VEIKRPGRARGTRVDSGKEGGGENKPKTEKSEYAHSLTWDVGGKKGG